MIMLRPYQNKAKELLRDKIKRGCKRIIYWAQTGAGKGLAMSDITNGAIGNGKKVLVVMRRRELIFQTYKNFLSYHQIRSSILMANDKRFDKTNHVQICSIDTISRRLDKLDFLKSFDVVLIDECHDTTSPTYVKLFDFLGEKFFIGFTATPFAVGGKPLIFWETYIKSMEAHELRDQGFLVDARLFAPKKIDVSNVKKVAGDYKNDELFDVVKDLKVVGDIVRTWKIYGQGRPTILFAVNKAHAQLMAHAFNNDGIRSIYCDESHTSEERANAINDLKTGNIKILCNVNIFSTGIDVPSIGCLILARPTMSEILYIQQVGRGLRPYKNKEDCIVLDHANNSERHGLPFDMRTACLTHDDIKKKKKEDEEKPTFVRTCMSCFAVVSPQFRVCPYCSAELLKSTREIEHEDGELIEVNKRSFNYERFRRGLTTLEGQAIVKNWKPNAKFFKLHKRFGDGIFEFEKELGLPKWLKRMIEENRAQETRLNQLDHTEHIKT